MFINEYSDFKEQEQKDTKSVIVTVHLLFGDDVMAFEMTSSSTILDVKYNIFKLTSLRPENGNLKVIYVDEMMMITGDDFHPYPLRDDLLVGNLLPQHRNLTLVVNFAPVSVTVPERFTHSVVPLYDGWEEESVLDLTYLSSEHLPFLRGWLDQNEDYGRIHVPITHALFKDILETISNTYEGYLPYLRVIDFLSTNENPLILRSEEIACHEDPLFVPSLVSYCGQSFVDFFLRSNIELII
jgi:hypothetical protein